VFNDKVMQSLLDAYAKCGGDPDELIRKLTQPELPALSGGEADFFKPYEDDMRGGE